MDETQHFCLRWNNYQSSITSAFENLRDDEDFVDVTLACEGRSIKAHRVVLSACSPYFRDLLKSTPCKHPVILLQDVNFLDLHSLVEFIYHGEVNVHQKSLQSFLKTAEVLKVSGLTQQQAEETHSQLAQIQNLANTAAAAAAAAAVGRNTTNLHHTPLHDECALYQRMQTSSPPPSHQLPLASQHLSNQFIKRSISGLVRRDRNVATPSAEDNNNHPLKRRCSSVTGIGPDNGFPPSNTNSPDLLQQQQQHPQQQQQQQQRSSPQLTAADLTLIKHNNNNTTQLKEEKRNGPAGNGTTGNGMSGGSGKLGSLTPSPLAHRAADDDVKAEPMDLGSNNNQNSGVCDEHSNDSTGEHDANRSSSADGGKGSLSSVNDEEVENSLPAHPPPPFLTVSPAESKLFTNAFSFPTMTNIDSALAGFNSQLQSAAEMSVSPQGPHHNVIRSLAASPSNSISAPSSPPTDLTSPTAGNNNAINMHASPPRHNNENVNGSSETSNSNGTPQTPLRMPPPTSGGINEPQECPYCRRTFSCYYSLKRHFQDKHEQSDTLYVCEFCHRRYRTKNSLTTHKSLQHRGSSGMLKRLLKTSAIKNVLVPHHHHHHHQQHHHHASLTHARAANLFDFTNELGQPPPGIQ